MLRRRDLLKSAFGLPLLALPTLVDAKPDAPLPPLKPEGFYRKVMPVANEWYALEIPDRVRYLTCRECGRCEPILRVVESAGRVFFSDRMAVDGGYGFGALCQCTWRASDGYKAYTMQDVCDVDYSGAVGGPASRKKTLLFRGSDLRLVTDTFAGDKPRWMWVPTEEDQRLALEVNTPFNHTGLLSFPLELLTAAAKKESLTFAPWVELKPVREF